MAEYAAEESNKRRERLRAMVTGSSCLMLVGYVLFRNESKGALNGIISDAICFGIIWFLIGLSIASLALYGLHCCGAFDKISARKKRRENKSR